MISDRDRRILSETERQIRLEDSDLARCLEAATPTGMLRRLRAGVTRAATSLPLIIILLLMLVVSLALELAVAMWVLIPAVTCSSGETQACRVSHTAL